jgi:hypothetical protein
LLPQIKLIDICMIVNKIKIFKNKVIKNKNGNLIKYISKENYFFKRFGEVYFNHIKFRKKKRLDKA